MTLAMAGQKGVYLDLAYVQALNNRQLTIDTRPVSDYLSLGYRANIFYNYPISKVDLRIGGGFKQLYFSGTADNTDFTGVASKGSLFVGGLYRWNKKWKTGLLFRIENNRDLDDFRSQTSDLYRYNAEFEINYAIRKDLFLVFNYSKALGPYSIIYMLSNPSDQFNLGLAYNLPWP